MRYMVPVKPIAEAVDKWRDEHDLSWAEVARELGWLTKAKYKDHYYYIGDTARVKRALGYKPDYSHTKKYYRKELQEQMALKFIRLIGGTPKDFGL